MNSGELFSLPPRGKALSTPRCARSRGKCTEATAWVLSSRSAHVFSCTLAGSWAERAGTKTRSAAGRPRLLCTEGQFAQRGTQGELKENSTREHIETRVLEKNCKSFVLACEIRVNLLFFY